MSDCGDDARSLTPEVIRQHLRERVAKTQLSNTSFSSSERHGSRRRRHTCNGHPGVIKTTAHVRKTNTIVRINVGGEEFITTRETIANLDYSRLAAMIEGDNYFSRELGVHFFDRSPEVFKSILDCHRYGQLHLPGHLCGNDLTSELQFWGVSMDRVAKCCINKLSSGRNEAIVYENVEQELSNDFEDLLIRSYREQGFDRIKLETYLFLEYPSFSIAASRWSTFFATLIIISTMNVALMSHEIGRQKKKDGNFSVDESILNLVNTSKWKKLWTTDVDSNLYFFDLALVTLFTLELFVRFFTGPNKLLFFKSWINIIDAVTIMMYWTKFMLSMSTKMVANGDARTKIEFAVFLFTELQFLRMFRILKLARNFTGLRVLILVLKNSRHELVTLIVFIIVGMFFFSFIIYVVEIYQQETFQNVPVAFWWSIVTMTTVGYGDHTPRGALGMIVGAFCAVSGMIISGLSIPILSNNFNIYYNTLEYQLRVHEERIREIKSLKSDIRQAKDVNDLATNAVRYSKTSEELEIIKNNGNGVKVDLEDDVILGRGPIAMPENGDVIYKSAGAGNNNDGAKYLLPPPDVEFKSGGGSSRSSVRTDVINEPIVEAIVDLEDVLSDAESKQRTSPRSSLCDMEIGEDAAADDVVDPVNDRNTGPDDVENPGTDVTSIRGVESPEEFLTNDVIDSPEAEMPPDEHSPPIPSISREVFERDDMMRHAESPVDSESEAREILI